MKKYSFLVFHQDYEHFVKKLYEVGVVDIIEKENISTVNEKLGDTISLIKKYKDAVKSMKSYAKTNDIKEFDPAESDFSDNKCMKRYESLKNYAETLNAQLSSISKDISLLSPWGDFDDKIIEALAQYGYHINFYTCSPKSFMKQWEEDFNAMIVNMTPTLFYFITLTKEEKITIEADKVKLPAKGLSTLLSEQATAKGKIEAADQEYKTFVVKSLNTMETEAEATKKQFDFSKVNLETEDVADNKVKLIEGWVPESKINHLEEVLINEDTVYTSRSPEATDKVPVLLKNNWFARLFEPIGELYTLPAYGEIDLTPFFAPFFMLFFGLCLGDAGYGLLLTIASLVMVKRVKPKMRGIVWLAFFLGLSTTICGIICGTFFGINLINADWPWLTKLKGIMLNSDQLFSASLIIGVVQIIFGMFLKVINQFKHKNYGGGLATIGWLTLILGCGATYLLSGKGIVTPELAKILYIVFASVGGVLIFILNNLKRNVFINFGSGLWDTYNMLTGLLGDVLSYIRLFALGISSSVMGFVFNDLAMNLSPDIIVVKQIVMILILAVGHSMNIFMSGLGSFVHPMRLTFVEFYKNAGFTGGGKKYSPFAEPQKN